MQPRQADAELQGRGCLACCSASVKTLSPRLSRSALPWSTHPTHTRVHTRAHTHCSVHPRPLPPRPLRRLLRESLAPRRRKSRPRNLEGSDGRAGHVAIVDTSSRGFLGMGIARGGVEPGRPLLYLRGVQVTSKGPFLLKADENLGRRCAGLRMLPLPRLAAVLQQASRSHL